MSICPFPRFEVRGNADLQGHLDTIYWKLIVSDGRGAEETRRGKTKYFLALTTKHNNLVFESESKFSITSLRLKDKLDLSFRSSEQDLWDRNSGSRQLQISEDENFLTVFNSRVSWAKPMPSKCQWSLDSSRLDYVPVTPSCLMPWVILPSASCQEPSC